MKFMHINQFYRPFVSGPTRHIDDVTKFTFNEENHIIVSLDLDKNLKEEEFYGKILHKRFQFCDAYDALRFMEIGASNNECIKKLRDFIRYIQPTCIVVYFIGILPLLLRNILPEMNIIYMPFGFEMNDYFNIFGTRKFKIALCGNECYNQYINAGAMHSQIKIIERPIDTEFYRPISSINRNHKQILYVGRLHPMKRLPEFVKSITPLLKKDKEIVFDIVADLSPSFAKDVTDSVLKDLNSIICQNELGNQIFLRGKLEGYELLCEYTKSSIHVLPSCFDRRSTVTQESITMGLYCVNTCKRLYDWPEYTDRGNRLVYYVDTVNDMLPIIDKLIYTDNFADNFEYSINNWSWKKWKKIYENLFVEW